MAVRTYFWESKKISTYNYYKAKLRNRKLHGFRIGNAGDIFAKDLLRFVYNEQVYNTRNEGNRILTVGSIASVIKENDIINGIGWKGNDLDNIAEYISKTKVYGVRGPLTMELFEKHGADLSNLKFQFDPGLLIKEVYNINLEMNSEKDIIFIPHYNDEIIYKNNYPKEFKVVFIDNKPIKIAKEIMNAKIVYSSSLHGIIFSHALNKPCVFVQPQSDESIFKYRDYFLSIGMSMPTPLKSIFKFNFIIDKATLLEKNIGLDDFYFPKKSELITKNIIIA